MASFFLLLSPIKVFEIDAQNLTLNSGESNCDVLHLVGLVTYYGKHYCTFFYNTQLGSWLYLDDANVKEIGNCWSYVVDKCIKASFQPLMLLYSSANSSNSINTNQAPKAVYQVPSNIKNNNNNSNNLSGLNSSINNRRSTSHLSQLVMLTNNAVNNKSSSITNNNSNSSSECDVPDSPFAKSSTASSAYFSDYYSTTEQEPQYISKRTVQNIIHAAQQKFTNHTANHVVNNHTNNGQHNHLNHHLNNNHFPVTNHQAQQRNSSSSLSDSFSTTEPTDDHHHTTNGGQVVPPIVPTKPVFRKELRSADAGYDSYSLSSSDSYPSIGGSAIGSTSSSGCSSNSNGTNKSTLRSIQEQSTENLLASQNSSNSVLADSQLLELINDDHNSTNQDSEDKLINRLLAQSDILLLRSHEKERENDLVTATALR